MIGTAAKGCAAVVVAVGVAWPALADGDWVRLNGAQIETALDGRKLKYETASQTFYKSGKTLYDAGRPSWGYWRIQGDEYCSQWPPNAGWECYGFERRMNASKGRVELRFMSQSGHATEGVYVE